MPPRVRCPDGHKRCPDCARARGGDGCMPLSAFNKGQDYCKPHMRARQAASRAKRSPDEARARRRASDRTYYESHRAERIAYSRAWKQQNPLSVRGWYLRWVARNPEKRAASQVAYRERQRRRP